MPSIEKHATRRTGETRYVIRFRDPDSRKQSSVRFATEPEAQQFVRDCDDRGLAWALTNHRREQGIDVTTLDQWAEQHFALLTAPSGATVMRYRRIYKECWQKPLGHLAVTAIARSDVAAALNAVGGSDKTRKNKWAVLTHMFKTAMQEGIINRSPCIGIKLGRHSDHEREEHRYVSIEEFSKILAATPVHWRPLLLTLAGTGMRWGEAAALNVGDVDFDANTIRITKAEKAHPEKPGHVIVGPTKSGKSRRTITVPSTVMTALAEVCEGRPKGERLFLPPNGGPLRHRTFYRDIWQRKCLPESGITQPYPRLHDLRHSHVAWLIAQNVPGGLPLIQARLGHEKITTTIDTYGHLLPDIQRAAAEAADVVFTGIVLPRTGPKEIAS